jgi:hypothetical protein
MSVSEEASDRQRDVPDAEAVPAVVALPRVDAEPADSAATKSDGAPFGQAGAPAAAPPVSERRVEECLDSASFWAEILAYHADGLQKRADTWSISAGLLAAIAGLSAWKLVTDQTTARWAIVLTSGLALAAAISALVPRIKNYAENAALSRELAARYGQSKGLLTDTLAWMKSSKANETVVRAVVADYEAIKKSKDSMRYVPIRSKETKKALLRKKSLSRNAFGRKTLTESGADPVLPDLPKTGRETIEVTADQNP